MAWSSRWCNDTLSICRLVTLHILGFQHQSLLCLTPIQQRHLNREQGVPGGSVSNMGEDVLGMQAQSVRSVVLTDVEACLIQVPPPVSLNKDRWSNSTWPAFDCLFRPSWFVHSQRSGNLELYTLNSDCKTIVDIIFTYSVLMRALCSHGCAHLLRERHKRGMTVIYVGVTKHFRIGLYIIMCRRILIFVSDFCIIAGPLFTPQWLKRSCCLQIRDSSFIITLK